MNQAVPIYDRKEFKSHVARYFIAMWQVSTTMSLYPIRPSPQFSSSL